MQTSQLISIVKNSSAQVVIQLKKQRSGVYTIPCKLNGLQSDFIFDTGASTVSISLEEAMRLMQKGLIDNEDFYGTAFYEDATGKISEGYKINIKSLEIDKIVLTNVEATIVNSINAPLLLGISALEQIGKVNLDLQRHTLTIINNKLIERSKTVDYFRNVILKESTYLDKFCGFKLLQYENCIRNQLGKPNREQEIGFGEKYYAYKLSTNKGNSNLIFHLKKLEASAEEKQIIAIQLSGDYSTYSIKGIGLGGSISDVSMIFGKPSSISSIQNKYGEGKLYEFSNTNISFEANSNIIKSIRIGYQDLIEEKRKNDQLTNFKLLKNVIKYFTTDELLSLLAPDFEIQTKHYDNIRFQGGFDSDRQNNKDLINFFNDKQFGFKAILSQGVSAEIALRIQENVGILWVIKIKNLAAIEEIVLKSYFDKYLIWEIH